DVEGHVDLGAEEGCAEVDFFDVDEDLGPEPYPLESRMVLSEGLIRGKCQYLQPRKNERQERGRGQSGDTYNLVIGSTRIVRPRRLLHNPLRNSLEIKQIVALRQRWLELYHLFPRLLLVGLLLDLHLDG